MQSFSSIPGFLRHTKRRRSSDRSNQLGRTAANNGDETYARIRSTLSRAPTMNLKGNGDIPKEYLTHGMTDKGRVAADPHVAVALARRPADSSPLRRISPHTQVQSPDGNKQCSDHL
jgi:hypothetical protein